jgi:hypothetical protein
MTAADTLALVQAAAPLVQQQECGDAEEARTVRLERIKDAASALAGRG